MPVNPPPKYHTFRIAAASHLRDRSELHKHRTGAALPRFSTRGFEFSRPGASSYSKHHYSNSDAQGRIPLRFCQVVLSLAITPIPNVPVVSRSHSIARRRLRDEHVGITDVRTRQSAAEKHFVPCSFRAISAGNAALKSPRAHQIQATHAKHTHVSSQAVVDVVGIVCPKKIQPTERAGGDKSSKHDPAPTSVRSPASQLETCNMTPPFAKQQ
eukprot:1287311-Rhodomonas_salina.2